MSKDKIEKYIRIFGNNNSKKLRKEFFEDELIRLLWEYISGKLTINKCFGRISSLELVNENTPIFTKVRKDFVKMNLSEP